MVITHRSRKRLLWCVNFALTTCILLTCAAAWRPPRAHTTSPVQSSNKSTTTDTTRLLGPISDYAIIHQHDIRRPLYDPKPVEKARPAPPPRITLKLTGTMIEQTGAYALLCTKKGKTVLASVGDMVEGARLIEIVPDQATVEYGGRSISLQVEEDKEAKR